MAKNQAHAVGEEAEKRAGGRVDVFTNFTTAASAVLGRAWIFVVALVLLALWTCSGPLMGFSDTWQLIVNTSTTIITVLMVFIIQNTQNRDNLAINIKLDRMMQAMHFDESEYIDAEDKTDKKLEAKKQKLERASRRKHQKSGSRTR
jgi:low affinity Fe/Cu permease